MATRHSATITPQAGFPTKIGDEDSNAVGLAAIRDFISNTDDRILHHTTFNFGSTVMALTLQGIILADTDETDDDDNPSVAVATYGELRRVEDTGHDREFKLILNDGVELTYRMGNAQTVAQLKKLIRTYRSQFLSLGEATAHLNAVHAEALRHANAEQSQKYEASIASVQQKVERTRNRLTAIATGAVAVAVVAVIIAVLV